ncbi:MAG: helicase-associated domain-containing protein, partial [Ktedonobacterales bacterium]
FVRRLAQRVGLLTTAGSRLLAADREKIARYLAYPLAERLRLCARVWVAGGWWPDVPSPTAPLPRLLTTAPPRLALARRRLTDQLASLSPGEPLPVSGDHATLAPGRLRRAASSRRTATAPDADAATVRAALNGPLTWFGVVIRESLPQTATVSSGAYTVTPAAAALVAESSDISLPEMPGRVVAQPNFEVIAFPPLTAPSLLLLDTCAREVALDTAARYQLSRESFAQARQHGWSAHDLVAQLESLTGAPLPANVRITLTDWERQGKRLSITEDVTALSVRDSSMLDALLADRAAASWIARRLTPTEALLVPEHASRVRRWLLRRGELPAVAGPLGEEPTG